MPKALGLSAQQPRPDLKVSILLVDDDPASHLALNAILGDLNQELVHAQSGEDALRFLQERNAALVLIDADMSGLSGFETARRMRTREQSRHTPIIFLTAQTAAEFRAAEAYELGAVDYLVKPLQPSILYAKVAALVELAAEKERAKREAAQLRLLVDGTTDYAIFLLDGQGRVVTWNVGAKRLKGYAAEEIIGQHFSRFYPKDMVARGWPEEELRRATAAGRFEDEGWRVRNDGSTFWANVVITALKDETGRLQGFSKSLSG